MPRAKFADHDPVIDPLDSFSHLRPVRAIWQAEGVLCLPLLLGKLEVRPLLALRQQLWVGAFGEIGVGGRRSGKGIDNRSSRNLGKVLATWFGCQAHRICQKTNLSGRMRADFTLHELCKDVEKPWLVRHNCWVKPRARRDIPYHRLWL